MVSSVSLPPRDGPADRAASSHLLLRGPSYYEDPTEEGADPGETRVQEIVGCWWDLL